MMDKIKQVGTGEFGPIYEGVEGKEAITYLLEKKNGEVKNAFTRQDIGNIDLVWGKEGKAGYGLVHFKDREGALNNLQEIVEEGILMPGRDQSVILMKTVEGSAGVAVVRLDWKGNPKRWIISSY